MPAPHQCTPHTQASPCTPRLPLTLLAPRALHTLSTPTHPFHPLHPIALPVTEVTHSCLIKVAREMLETIDEVNEKVRQQENALRMRGILTAELQVSEHVSE